MTWIKVASKDDIQEGSGKELNINGQRIASICIKKQVLRYRSALQTSGWFFGTWKS